MGSYLYTRKEKHMTIQTDLVALARIKDQIASLNEKKGEIETQIITAMDAKGNRNASVTIDGATIKATVVAPQRVVIDEQKVKDRLDAKAWRKVTRTVLDKEKLEAAVALGDVDANVVAECSEIKDTKPYVKITGDVKAIATGQPKRVVRAKPRA